MIPIPEIVASNDWWWVATTKVRRHEKDGMCYLGSLAWTQPRSRTWGLSCDKSSCLSIQVAFWLTELAAGFHSLCVLKLKEGRQPESFAIYVDPSGHYLNQTWHYNMPVNTNTILKLDMTYYKYDPIKYLILREVRTAWSRINVIWVDFAMCLISFWNHYQHTWPRFYWATFSLELSAIHQDTAVQDRTRQTGNSILQEH
jgi:hypothetical protein